MKIFSEKDKSVSKDGHEKKANTEARKVKPHINRATATADSSPNGTQNTTISSERSIMFQFMDNGGYMLRERPLAGCDTVHKLFGQAVIAGILPESKTEARLLQAKIEGSHDGFGVFEGDETDFADMMELIASCTSVVEIRAVR